MAVKGAKVKEEIKQKILEVFEGSFVNDKEIRVPMIEDGAEVQIKITLTAAQNIVEAGSSTAIPGAVKEEPSFPTPAISTNEAKATELSEKEKADVQALFAKLGL